MSHTHSDPITDCPGSGSGKKRGLLIAIKDNRVEGCSKLDHVQRDAKEVQRLLIELFGYPLEDTVLMLDDKSTPSELWPTKIRIRKQIQRFVQGVSAGDHLFFYYSGHGRQVPCNHHTESDGLDEEIYTCDGREIMDNDLKKWLVDPLPPGCKLFALWDSCHSHTILDLDHYICNEPRSAQLMRQCREFQSTLWRVLPKPFRACILGPALSRSYLDVHPGRNSVTPVPRSAFTIASHGHRGRPVARASVSIAAVSAGSSPPLSKWIPISVEGFRQRVLSPLSWPSLKCNGKCSLPTESDTKCAHVISLSACKDSESAVDDYCNGVTKFFIDHLRAKPKSTLGELLLAIRQRVDEITAARQAWDMETGVISRRSTFASGRRITTEWTPQVIRRNTEVNVDTVEELPQSTQSSAREKHKNKYSQKPSYSSHYRLNLDEFVDL